MKTHIVGYLVVAIIAYLIGAKWPALAHKVGL